MPRADCSYEDCPHEVYTDDRACIFHSGRATKKEKAFHKALAKLITANEADDDIKRHNFTGFVFPAIQWFHELSKPADFRKATFSAYADFTSVTFSADAYFISATFSADAYFISATFSADAYFSSATFSADADFSSATFSAYADFSSATFSAHASFSSATFSAHASFWEATFSADASFSSATFSADASFSSATFSAHASFSSATFSAYADFRGADFKNRSDFRGARYHGELQFENARFAFLKNPPSAWTGQAPDPRPQVNLSGAVLESAHLWGIARLERYAFRDAFLLSLSLAEKEIVDCDFTGAVMDAVHTRGWKLDAATLANTKYIYTYYKKEKVIEEGRERWVYTALPESRVPADGEFGDAANPDFTIAEHLREYYRWSFSPPDLPPQIRTAITNYFNYFKDYMEATEAVTIEVRVKKEGRRVRVEFLAETQKGKKLVEGRFREFLNHLRSDGEPDPDFSRSNKSPEEQRRMISELNVEIATLKLKLDHAKEIQSRDQRHIALLTQVNNIMQAPAATLMPPKVSFTDTPTFIMNADLVGYSKAVAANSDLKKIINDFLFDQQVAIKKKFNLGLSKLEGDCIKAFVDDGKGLVWIAEDVIQEVRRLHRAHRELKGVRVILGYGICTRHERGEQVDYTGEAIIETVRGDQPLKEMLDKICRQSDDPPAWCERDQIWCTASFKEKIDGQDDRIVFEKAPPLEGAKGYGPIQLYRVVIRHG